MTAVWVGTMFISLVYSLLSELVFLILFTVANLVNMFGWNHWWLSSYTSAVVSPSPELCMLATPPFLAVWMYWTIYWSSWRRDINSVTLTLITLTGRVVPTLDRGWMDTLMASKCSRTSLLTTVVLYCIQGFIGGLICFFVCLFLVILRVCVLLKIVA